MSRIPNWNTILLGLFLATLGVAAIFSFRPQEPRVREDEFIVELARKRAKEGEVQSLLFLAMRADLLFDLMGQNRVIKSDVGREIAVAKEAHDSILRVCARSDNAFYSLLGAWGLTEEEQMEELFKRVKVVMEDETNNPVSADMLARFGAYPDLDVLAELGMDHSKAIEVLLKKTQLASKGRPLVGFQLAKYLYSRDSIGNKAETERLVAEGIATLEKKGGSWNPFAYEFLGELFRDGYGSILPPDPKRSEKYFRLFEEAKKKAK
jgi:hypothetical protein